MTTLVRVDEKTYSRLQKMAGKIQASRGKKTSLCEAIVCLLDGGKIIPAKKIKTKKVRKHKEEGKKDENSHELVPYFQRREIH